MSNKISFNSRSKEYQYLSNFYQCKIVIDNIEYSSVEQYFQAMKFPHCSEYQEIIRNTQDPREIKILGRQKCTKSASERVLKQINQFKDKDIFRKDWNDIKMKIMLKAVQAKFDQNPDLKEKLLQTKGKYLQENTRQKVWKTSLGLILMYVRDQKVEWNDEYSEYIKKENYFQFYKNLNIL